MGWRRSDDAGMTLIEVSVALVVVMIAMTALLAAMLASIRSAHGIEVRTKATQLTTDRIEELSGLAWDKVGFYAGEGPSSHGGEPTVCLGSTRPANDTAPSHGPVTVERDRVSYTLTTYVTWNVDTSIGLTPAYDCSGASEPYSYKRITAVVEWSAQGAAKSMTLQALRSPTTTEVLPPAPTPSSSATPTATPSPTATPTSTATTAPGAFAVATATASPNQTLDSGNRLTQALTVTVTTNQAAQIVTATYPMSSGTGTLTLAGDAAGTTWTATLPVGSGPFIPGTTAFAVAAVSAAAETASATASAVLSAPALGPIVVLQPTVSPYLCVTNNGSDKDRMRRASTVSVEIQNVASTDVPKLSWTQANGGPVNMTDAGTGLNGGRVFSATIPTGTRLTSTSTTLYVTVLRGADQQSGNGTFPGIAVTRYQQNEAGCP